MGFDPARFGSKYERGQSIGFAGGAIGQRIHCSEFDPHDPGIGIARGKCKRESHTYRMVRIAVGIDRN